ncbi:MAG: hypothetical protein LBB26_03595 [Puniceicoccales bacterium]|jgi:hypothetical protein|nr:hypothetical protein [Puniceicoccales bacterium]
MATIIAVAADRTRSLKKSPPAKLSELTIAKQSATNNFATYMLKLAFRALFSVAPQENDAGFNGAIFCRCDPCERQSYAGEDAYVTDKSHGPYLKPNT